VKIIAAAVAGSGLIDCQRDGRVRIETPLLEPDPVTGRPRLITAPETVAVLPANPPRIWPPDNAPKARILSVGAIEAPEDPKASMESAPYPADIVIENDRPVVIAIETRNLPLEGSKVEVFFRPKWYDPEKVFPYTQPAKLVSGTQTLALWRVETVLPKGFTTLLVRATAP
jgi:hypothetical protein